MPLEPPRLDDRRFRDLVQEALRRIPQYAPEWTDYNPSDPGVALLELFAWMTEITLARLNLVPEQHFIKFMQLIGMKLRESEPAQTELTLWLSTPQPADLMIPTGVRVGTPRTETQDSIVFTTTESLSVRVAEMTEVLTSTLQDEREGQTRVFKEQNLRRIQSGFEGFFIFADPPKIGDAVYFGFRRDLSRNILGLELDVDVAGGAGVDPTRPPYVWQALSGTPAAPEWLDCEVEYDGTKAFNVPGTMRIFLPKMSSGDVDGKRAYWVRCRLIEPASGALYVRSPLIRRVNSGTWGGMVDAIHADVIHAEFLGRSDGTPGQRFYLANSPILKRDEDEHLIVRIGNDHEEIWTEVEDFTHSSENDRHYRLDSETGEIRFGPALSQRDGSIHRYGMIPPRNSAIVMARYRYGGGVIGNVQKGALSVLLTSIPYVAQVSNRQSAVGGLNMENLEEAKMRVPGYLHSLRRAVTANDYVYLATQAAAGKVARVHAIQPPNSTLGEVKVLVIPAVTDATDRITPRELRLSPEINKVISDYLDERRLLTTRLDVTSPAYYWVSSRVVLKIHSYADADTVREAAEKRLYQFLNPILGGHDGKGWAFGRDLYTSDIMFALQSVPGIEVIQSVELYPVTWGAGDKARRGEQTPHIEIVAHGILASYRHEVRVEK